MAKGIFSTPQDAEAAFYEAFEKADPQAMMAVWAAEEDIVCIHPMGPRLRGYASVQMGWRRLFAEGSRMRFRISDVQYTQGALLSIHIVQQNVLLNGNPQPRPPLIATNVYQLTDIGWRMILHHASPSPATSQDHPPKPSVLH